MQCTTTIWVTVDGKKFATSTRAQHRTRRSGREPRAPHVQCCESAATDSARVRERRKLRNTNCRCCAPTLNSGARGTRFGTDGIAPGGVESLLSRCIVLRTSFHQSLKQAQPYRLSKYCGCIFGWCVLASAADHVLHGCRFVVHNGTPVRH